MATRGWNDTGIQYCSCLNFRQNKDKSLKWHASSVVSTFSADNHDTTSVVTRPSKYVLLRFARILFRESNLHTKPSLRITATHCDGVAPETWSFFRPGFLSLLYVSTWKKEGSERGHDMSRKPPDFTLILPLLLFSLSFSLGSFFLLSCTLRSFLSLVVTHSLSYLVTDN